MTTDCNYICLPDSKVHGGQHGTKGGPVGPMLAPWALLSGLSQSWRQHSPPSYAWCKWLLCGRDQGTVRHREAQIYYLMILDPFVDEDGIERFGGCLWQGGLSFETIATTSVSQIARFMGANMGPKGVLSAPCWPHEQIPRSGHSAGLTELQRRSAPCWRPAAAIQGH